MLVERTYLITMITDSSSEHEDYALEQQAEILDNIAMDWEMVK
jgi:hypothetical protein